MKDAGPAWMSIGHGSGKNRAVDAAREALASPLLDVSVTGSNGILFNIVGSEDLTLFEVNEAAEVIKQAVDPDANIIFGVGTNSSLEQEVRITLIATGFVTKTGFDESKDEQDELAALLKGIKTEDELDVPSFLRKPLFNRQRQASMPSAQIVRPERKAPTNLRFD